MIAHKVCQTGILGILLPVASTYTVALMAVDRAIYLKKPLTYVHIVTPWRMFFAVVVIWLLSIALSLPPLFGFGQVDFIIDVIACVPPVNTRSRFGYLILLTVLAGLATVVQLVGCGFIIYITRKHLLKRFHRSVRSFRGNSQKHRNGHAGGRSTDTNRNKHVHRQYTASQLQLVKVFGAIVTASVITYTPLAALGISALFVVIKHEFALLTYLSVLSRSVIHPILESYMTYEIRIVISKCWKLCHYKKACGSGVHTRAEGEVSSTPAKRTITERYSSVTLCTINEV